MNKEKISVAIVGATGLVGRNFIKALEDYLVPIDKLILFASKNSLAKPMKYLHQTLYVDTLKKGCFKGIDFALFSAGAEISKKWCPIAEEEGCIVIDNSSFFRQENDIALVVPEVNFNDIFLTKRKIIANPNCSTIPCMASLKCLDQLFKLKKVIYSTYQSVSGSGKRGIDALVNNSSFYPYDIHKTCIPLIGDLLYNNSSIEEKKMKEETRKILHIDSLLVEATCVRVPILEGHGVSIYAETEQNIDISSWIQQLKQIENLEVLYGNKLPNTIDVYQNDKVQVGRIRIGEKKNTILFFVTLDNLRKGAAGNAVQILTKILEKKGAVKKPKF